MTSDLTMCFLRRCVPLRMSPPASRTHMTATILGYEALHPQSPQTNRPFTASMHVFATVPHWKPRQPEKTAPRKELPSARGVKLENARRLLRSCGYNRFLTYFALTPPPLAPYTHATRLHLGQ
jgi:hypothetical protein